MSLRLLDLSQERTHHPRRAAHGEHVGGYVPRDRASGADERTHTDEGAVFDAHAGGNEDEGIATFSPSRTSGMITPPR